MKLTLIRHGQTPSNVAGALDTAPPGPGLTDLGAAQAAAIPDALAPLRIDRLYASNQLRAQLTAEPLANNRDLPVTVLDGLREIAAGDLEMAIDADAIHTYIGTLFRWLEGDLRARMPGGASGAEFLERYDAAIDAIVAHTTDTDPEAQAVAVSHGAAIRVWSALRCGQESSLAAGRRHMENTGAVTLQRDNGIWRVVNWQQSALGGAAVASPPRIAEADPTSSGER